MVPGPPPELNGADPTSRRLKCLEEAPELVPAFPVVPDIDDAVWLAGAIRTRPGCRCLLRRTVGTGLGRRVVTKKQERAYVFPQGRERGLQNLACDGLETLDPFPALVPIQLHKVIAVMLDSDRLVICPGTINDDSTLLWHTVEQIRKMRQIWKIVRLVNHEDCEVERLDVHRVRHRREIRARLAKHSHFVSQPLADLGVSREGPDRAYSAL